MNISLVKLVKGIVFSICMLHTSAAYSQAQACPANFNFGFGNLTNWSAYTGNNKNGNGPAAIQRTYNNTNPLPLGTFGETTIPEYQVSNTGINTIASNGTDPFGLFPTIPTINGYAYTNSVRLGSTSIASAQTGTGPSGGYIRGISYIINVPTSAIVQPYTITYAYAMVIENGSHATSQQPLITATLTTSAGVITCASPQYTLPTLGNVNTGGGGATLDTAAARIQGFTLSGVPSPNNNGNAGESRYRVYTKGWREVTIDLSAYRGQQVTLTFEADNCVPGGHFSYAYIALRDVCAGLQITGNISVCANSTQTYSIPTLAGATYTWTLPSGWSFVSGQDSNIVVIKAGTTGGQIIAHEINSCADLYDTLQVTVLNPGLPGVVTGSTSVCTGTNSQTLTLTSYTGSVVAWLSSVNNGLSWQRIANTSSTYTATNLTTTTQFRVLVQTNGTCPVDTSTTGTITVNPRSVGGTINPPNTNICLDQTANSLLTLSGNTGSVVNWQSSADGGLSWLNFTPVKTDTVYAVNGSITANLKFRTIVQSGVCPADTSTIASITQISTPFPAATYSPADTTICFGTTAPLNATITTGTSYTWIHTQALSGAASGNISAVPYPITVTASPVTTSVYILSVQNTGCPNLLLDTFTVRVLPAINVFAGNDTAIVIGQPLVFQSSADNSAISYLWTPAAGLNNTTILRPTAIITDAIANGNFYKTYVLTVKNAIGCTASDTIVLRVFKTLPSIFVPNAFTPNGDGNNDVLRPVLAGIERLDYFRVYNRFGELVFDTHTPGHGWSGFYKGVQQPTGTFVYMVQAMDYTGRILQQKGSSILIR
jgi:gliding motility-associated-like protein